MPEKENRLKSWVVWASVLGAVGILLNKFGVLSMIGLDSATWNICIDAIGTVLIAFGILNNPTDRHNF